MEKASFKAQVGRNQFLDIYVFPLSSVELYQGSEYRGRDWDWKSSPSQRVGIQMFCVCFLEIPSIPTYSPMFAVCSIIPQPSAFQWLCLFSSAPLPGGTGCAPTASPSTPESFPLKQIPPRQTCSNQAEQRRKSRRASGVSQSKLSPHTWRKRTSFHMQRAVPFSTAVSKIGINY